MGNAANWKESLVERTKLRQKTNLMQLVYGKSVSKSTTSSNEVQGSSEDESEDENFFKPKGEGNEVCCGGAFSSYLNTLIGTFFAN